jgi:hypothetical protein
VPAWHAEVSRFSKNGSVTRQWALAGHGIALKAWIDVCEDVAAGRLVHILPDFRSETYPIMLIMSATLRLAARMRALGDCLAERFDSRLRPTRFRLLLKKRGAPRAPEGRPGTARPRPPSATLTLRPPPAAAVLTRKAIGQREQLGDASRSPPRTGSVCENGSRRDSLLFGSYGDGWGGAPIERRLVPAVRVVSNGFHGVRRSSPVCSASVASQRVRPHGNKLARGADRAAGGITLP